MYTNAKPIYEDVNADKLAIKYKANLVMTNSSFVHLIYSLSKQNDDDLKLPMVVKSLKDTGNLKTRRPNTIYIIIFLMI